MSSCVIQVLDGDTETHYVNPVWLTVTIDDPEEAYDSFDSMIHEFEDLILNLMPDEETKEWYRSLDKWEIKKTDTKTEYRTYFPFEIIFTIEQAPGNEKPDILNLLAKKYGGSFEEACIGRLPDYFVAPGWVEPDY